MSDRDETPVIVGNHTGLVFTSSCPPYTSDCVLRDDVGGYYCVSDTPCDECGCHIAAVEFDADGDSEGFYDRSTYECAACGGEVEADWTNTRNIESFIRKIAESMFPGDDENVAARFLTTTYAETDNGLGQRPAVDPMDASQADWENGQTDEADHE